MLMRICCISMLFVAVTFLVDAQTELPEGEFCYSSPATIHAGLGQAGGEARLNTFRMFLIEELDDGWFKVLYEGEIGYVENPDCLSISELHAEADPIIADALEQLEANPLDHEALAEMARGSVILGDYVNAITYIEQAIVLEPRNPYYNTMLGVVYREFGHADELMRYLIPDIPLQDDWYIAGKGTENIYHSFYDDIPLIGEWMILQLATWTYVAVPEGWILSDDIANSFIGLDLDMTDLDSANPNIMLRIVQDFHTDEIAEMPEYLYETLSGWGDAQLIDSVIFDDDTGYVIITYPDDGDGSLNYYYWILAFSRALPSDVDGGWRIFMYATTTRLEWEHYYPLMQSIIANARNFEFTPVGVVLPLEINFGTKSS
jgi:tetratricopeptide (TPR) repeat protein